MFLILVLSFLGFYICLFIFLSFFLVVYSSLFFFFFFAPFILNVLFVINLICFFLIFLYACFLTFSFVPFFISWSVCMLICVFVWFLSFVPLFLSLLVNFFSLCSFFCMFVCFLIFFFIVYLLVCLLLCPFFVRVTEFLSLTPRVWHQLLCLVFVCIWKRKGDITWIYSPGYQSHSICSQFCLEYRIYWNLGGLEVKSYTLNNPS